MRDLFYDPQLDKTAGEQTECPAGPSFGRIAASYGHQNRLLLAVQLAGLPRTPSVMEGPFQPPFHELLTGPLDRRAAHVQRVGDGLIGETVMGQQEEVGATELAGPGAALADELQKLAPLLLCQVDDIRLFHGPPVRSGADAPR